MHSIGWLSFSCNLLLCLSQIDPFETAKERISGGFFIRLSCKKGDYCCHQEHPVRPIYWRNRTEEEGTVKWNDWVEELMWSFCIFLGSWTFAIGGVASLLGWVVIIPFLPFNGCSNFQTPGGLAFSPCFRSSSGSNSDDLSSIARFQGTTIPQRRVCWPLVCSIRHSRFFFQNFSSEVWCFVDIFLLYFCLSTRYYLILFGFLRWIIMVIFARGAFFSSFFLLGSWIFVANNRVVSQHERFLQRQVVNFFFLHGLLIGLCCWVVKSTHTAHAFLKQSTVLVLWCGLL